MDVQNDSLVNRKHQRGGTKAEYGPSETVWPGMSGILVVAVFGVKTASIAVFDMIVIASAG
jgi:hypothetical protein